MANTCLVTRLQGVVTGDNLIKFGTLRLDITKDFLTSSATTASFRIRFTDVPSGETPTIKIDVPFNLNDTDYAAGATASLTPNTSSGVYNVITIQRNDIPVNGACAYITHKYNLTHLMTVNTTTIGKLSASEISYLPKINSLNGIAVDGNIGDIDNISLSAVTFVSPMSQGSAADYKYPEKITRIMSWFVNFPIEVPDLLDYVNLTNLILTVNPGWVADTTDLIQLFSTLTKLNTGDWRNSGVTCNADTLAAGLQAAGVVSRTINITLYGRQWDGGTGTSSVQKTFTFDENGDYVIS